MIIKGKEDAIFVKGVVVPCGLADKTNDKPVYKEDIKKIFTNYLTYETDVQHSWVANFGVYLLENTLEKSETTIAGQTVPADSWTASMMIVNPDIMAMIREGKLNGFSLGAVGDSKLNGNKDFLNKALRYETLKDAETLNPIFISLVDKPANGFKWEVLTYKQFLAKSLDYERDIMSNIEETKIEDDSSVLVRVIETLTNALSKKDDAVLMKSEEEEKEEKEEGEVLEKEEPTVAELIEKIPTPEDIAEAVVKALKALSEEQLEKSEESSEEEKEEEEEEKEVLEKECKEEEETMEKSIDTPEKPEKLEKSITTKIPETNTRKPAKTFLNSETRDMFGRNKKYL